MCEEQTKILVAFFHFWISTAPSHYSVSLYGQKQPVCSDIKVVNHDRIQNFRWTIPLGDHQLIMHTQIFPFLVVVPPLKWIDCVPLVMPYAPFTKTSLYSVHMESSCSTNIHRTDRSPFQRSFFSKASCNYLGQVSMWIHYSFRLIRGRCWATWVRAVSALSVLREALALDLQH